MRIKFTTRRSSVSWIEKNMTRLHAIKIYIKYLNFMMCDQTGHPFFMEEKERARKIKEELTKSLDNHLNF